MTTITAKATVTNVVESETQVTVYMGADYGTEADPINQEWAPYTPALSLAMSVKPSVAEHFPVGGHFTLTFELDEPTAEVPAADPTPAPEIPTSATELPATETTPESTPAYPSTDAPAAPSSAPAADAATYSAAAEVTPAQADPLAVAPTTVDHNPYAGQ